MSDRNVDEQFEKKNIHCTSAIRLLVGILYYLHCETNSSKLLILFDDFVFLKREKAPRVPVTFIYITGNFHKIDKKREVYFYF